MKFTHGLSHTKIIVAWKNLRSRCDNQNNPSYKNYGGRGVTYDKRWKKSENFLEDMLPSFIQHVKKHGEHETTLDRIDTNGNYSKQNCKWATRLEQAQTRSSTKFITLKGKTLKISGWFKELGLNNVVFYRRIKRGLTVEQALLAKNREYSPRYKNLYASRN